MAAIERTAKLANAEARRLRSSARRLSRGVYAVGSDRTNLERLATRARGALTIAPPGSLVCGVTALALAQVRLPKQAAALAAGPVCIAIPRESGLGWRRPEISAVRLQVLPPAAPARPQGIAVAHLAHCWMQVVAESMRHPGWDFVHKDKVPTSPGVFTEPRKAAFLESIQIGDRLMARHDPLIAHEEFAAYIGSLTNARGVRLARSMSGFVRARTDSTMETWLRLVVWDAGFPDPMVNYPVTAAGQSRFLDLAWPELRIDLEFHGRQHFYEWEQAYGDVQRRGQLQMEGWVTVEATEEQLISPGKLLHRLGAVFASQRSARWRG